MQQLAAGTRIARKHHQCFECYRYIAPGEKYGFQNNVYDGRAYTLKYHLDCAECASEWRKAGSAYYDDEGYGPLRDEWLEGGEYKSECDNWRGFYPHVVARMELTDQIRGSRRANVEATP